MEQQSIPDLEQSVIEEKDYYESYLGDNAEYYMKRFERIDDGATVIFNVYAFFLGFFWLSYKKMYVEALIIFLVITAIEFIIPENSGVDRIFSILCSVTMGCFANYLYYKKVIRVVEKTREKYSDNDQTSQMDVLNILYNKGKPDWIIFIAIFVVLVSLIILGIILPNEY